MITLAQIKELLDFYQIDDIDYYDQCRFAYEDLKNKNLFDTFETLHHRLFLEGRNFLKFWYTPTPIALFGCEVHPFATNLLLLSGGYLHQKKMKELDFDAYQIEKHKLRVRGTLTNDLIVKKLPGIRVTQVIWGAYFVHGIIIECGSLQFEYAIASELLGWDKDHIEIHIPIATSLKKEDVVASIDMAKTAAKKYFGLEGVDFCCYSWLLSPQVNDYLNETSNIRQFYEMFEVEAKDDCESDIRNHLFNDTSKVPFEKLPENSSLQKSVKQALMEGVKFYRGKGTLK